MALGIFLVSIFIAVATAAASALSGGSVATVIMWGIGTAWASSVALTAIVALRWYMTKSDRPIDASTMVPAGFSNHS
ncbi:hypothetical protein [Tropicimonas isoalkanivorans]|uniref:Uncharacterized protein n=1 Tax=Tropicimonas isoalkanivorans TaxID=441112 RepID=A0A1I1NI75_9RHOB|nr:hypothetical protein [Tropicimonas isoalkanivorans]SFC97185.1 hypothetical protein SAMN04488094_11282 [Tropicimonas isoalkanivorans]